MEHAIEQNNGVIFKISTINGELNIPDNVSTVQFTNKFDQTIDSIQFPNTIHTIIFGHRFSQNIDNVKFPDSVHTIQFGYGFHENIDNVKFPKNLNTIVFGEEFSHDLSCLKKIPTLKKIFIHDSVCDYNFIVQTDTGYMDAKTQIPDGCVLIRHDYDWSH